MLIRIVAALYGDRYGTVHRYGEVWDAPEHIARKLVRGGVAVPVARALLETVMTEPSEYAARVGRPPGRKRVK